MAKNTDIVTIYTELLSKYQATHQKLKRQLKSIALLRLTFFVLTVVSIIYLRKFGAVVVVPCSVFCFAGFLFLIKKYISKEKEKQFFENLIKINEDELKALKGDFSHFKNGAEFSDPLHSYSYDLDLFGAQSFFQFLNRTATERGQKQLAKLLQANDLKPENIIQKQQAIEELAEELEWRQHFLAAGTNKHDQLDFDVIHKWAEKSFKLKNEKTIHLLTVVFPVLSVAAIFLNIFSIIPWSAVMLTIMAQWISYGVLGKKINQFYEIFGNSSKILSTYAGLMNRIEDKDFQSDFSQKLKQQLFHKDQAASKISFQLKSIISKFDYRNNMVTLLVFNSLFMWDIRCVYKLSKWHENYHHLLDEWFDVIAEFDALLSLANYNYNHPEWTLPKPVADKFKLEAKDLGHPLLDQKKRIDNNFKIDGEGKLSIITGANMAGKSTFLRTVGINLVLAMNGCRVCAKQFDFKPIQLYTNMRTTDNLMNDESYFYAELLRLQQMLERIRIGEKLFVIIDEMLKGTNSIDKLNGSKELVKQLIELNAVGIVATHDLKLTDLAKKLPEAIQNQCFEVQLNKDDLNFDYKLRDGVTQTMNATFLMKKMGIIEA